MTPTNESKIHQPSVSEVLREESWPITRKGRVEEVRVELESGGYAIRYRVTVWDPPREPFLRQMFNDNTAADDFLDKVMDQSRR